jgi:hypothetical protein
MVCGLNQLLPVMPLHRQKLHALAQEVSPDAAILPKRIDREHTHPSDLRTPRQKDTSYDAVRFYRHHCIEAGSIKQLRQQPNRGSDMREIWEEVMPTRDVRKGLVHHGTAGLKIVDLRSS